MASFGEELRRQRELRGVSLREISDATKINIRFLESLESDDFTHLPGGQFNKGFIRAFARHIGVNPEVMVDSYLLELKRQEESEKALGRAVAPRRTGSVSGSRTAAIGVAVLILIVALSAAVWWVVRARLEMKEAAAGQPAVESQAQPPAGSAAPTDNQPGGDHPSEPVREGTSQASEGPGGPGPTDRSATGQPPTGDAPAAGSSPVAGAEPTAGDAAAAGEPAATGPASEPIPGAIPAASLPLGAGQTPAPPAGAISAPAPAQGNVVLRVIPLQPSRLGLLCNGKDIYSGDLQAGQVIKFECAGVFEVSMDDAGAMNLSVNGERIYLGRQGQSISGRHVSAANYLDYVNPPSGASPP